jgi:hypothetical protein
VLAGHQCARRLWLQAHAPERAEPPGPDALERLERGRLLGERARGLFPGGVLVQDVEFERARGATDELVARADVPALFEGAFEHACAAIRVDVLERLGPSMFGLREVKSATTPRDEHLDDVVLQLFVLRGCGLDVRSVELVLVDPDYERVQGEVDWTRFFVRHDVTQDAEFLLSDVAGFLREFEAALQGDEPGIEPSPHCRRPRSCEFHASCASGKPQDWIDHLPALRSAQFHDLLGRGVQRISEIPDDYPLKDRQVRARAAHLSGRESVDSQLGERLAGHGPPAAYLDFEAMAPAVPLYPGMRPFQPIPFQWSLHRAAEDGTLSHAEFLAKPGADPRRAFAEALVAELSQGEEPVHVYSAYETGVLAELARSYSDLASRIGAIRARLFDMLPVVRDSIYSVGFRGSFSIKRVVPVLVPGFSYDDLEAIRDGGGAARAITALLQGHLAAAEVEATCSALRAYCARDTLALVELHRALLARCEARS